MMSSASRNNEQYIPRLVSAISDDEDESEEDDDIDDEDDG